MAIIEVRDLVKRYGGRTAVDGVSFAVEPGEVFGILGPAGAGKTTTVECVAGLRTPDGGSVAVRGLAPPGARRQRGCPPDRLTVRAALERSGATAGDLGLTAGPDTPVPDLPSGQLQRVCLALALAGDLEVVVLDEVTAGLGPRARRDTWDLVDRVRDRGATVLLATRSAEEAERLCDRLALIDSGRLAALDTPAGLVARVEDRRRVRFRRTAPLDPIALSILPEVDSVETSGDWLVATGRGDLLLAVTTALIHLQSGAVDLSVEPATLDDAFTALTGRRIDP